MGWGWLTGVLALAIVMLVLQVWVCHVESERLRGELARADKRAEDLRAAARAQARTLNLSEGRVATAQRDHADQVTANRRLVRAEAEANARTQAALARVAELQRTNATSTEAAK